MRREDRCASRATTSVNWFLVLGSWFLVPDSWFLVPGSWFSVLGSRFLVPGSWFLVPDSWFLVLGSWFSVPGSWFSVLDQENAMDPLQLLILLVIAGICGAVAELIVGFSPPGLHVMLVSIIIGVIAVRAAGLFG